MPHKGILCVEDARPDAIELVAPHIVVAVAVCAGKAGCGNVFLLKCLQHLGRAVLRDHVDLMKLRSCVCFCFGCGLQEPRVKFKNSIHEVTSY